MILSFAAMSVICSFFAGGAPKERRRRRAEKRSFKRVILESPFLLCPLKVFKCSRASLKGTERKRTLQNHLFGWPFLRMTPSPLACSE